MKKANPPISYFAIFIISLLAASTVQAQGSYPEAKDLYINDFAGLLTARDNEEIRTALMNLRNETGVELSVVTIRSIRGYKTGDETLESFATNLFNTWGIGDRQKNDGALILVAARDRKVRIELGSGYGPVAIKIPWNPNLTGSRRTPHAMPATIALSNPRYRPLFIRPSFLPALNKEPWFVIIAVIARNESRSCRCCRLPITISTDTIVTIVPALSPPAAIIRVQASIAVVPLPSIQAVAPIAHLTAAVHPATDPAAAGKCKMKERERGRDVPPRHPEELSG